MKNYIGILSAVVLLGTATSCSDYFLNLNPTDTQTEGNYFKNAAQFEAAANGTYSFYGFKDVTETVNGAGFTHTLYNLWDGGSDIGGLNEATMGTLAASQNDTYWSLCYAKIRKCNVVIEKGEAYTGTDNIQASIATAKFFRAYQYFWLLQRFGGVPLVTRMLSTGSEELYAARNSRYEVAAQILSDLDDAIQGLPEEKNYDGKVTKQGAQAFKARVLLFEGTWEKYVKETTDGNGTSEGAGSAKPAGYPSVEAMLTEAASLADAVISSGKFQLWNAENTPYESIAYNYLFNLEDENTNPMGFKKDQNKEYILQICHNPVSNKCSKNITHSYGATFATTLGGSIPLKWMLMVPCTTDGLPYFYSQDYKGFNKINDIYDNRDYRLTSTVMIPGQTYYIMGVIGADKSTYAKADYVTTFDFPEGCSVYYPTVTATGATGFMNRKMCSERKDYGDGDEAYNYPVLRLAEMYLIYAEAKCELGNGSISDTDLNKSINVLHRRGGSAPISNASIAAANTNYAKNTGKSGNLTMLELIRNERAVELRNENFRPTDLLRWGIAEEVMKNNFLGVVTHNPDGSETEFVNFTYELAGKTVSIWSDAAASAYGYDVLDDGSKACIVTPKTQVNMTRKNYLYPIPLAQIQLNPALLQNPGY